MGRTVSATTESRPDPAAEHPFAFGPFRLAIPRRLLLRGDQPVRLGSRALDILAALVERAGEVVSKEELIARAWPTTVVEEGNLKLQISGLRRTLGDSGENRYIITVPGRGYNFVAPVSREAEPRGTPRPTVAASRLHNLPFAMTRTIGRDEIVATLISRLTRERLVTIVGPGGIGKTTVALVVAEAMVAAHEHGVWLVDLAPLGDPDLVPSALATAVGVQIRSQDAVADLIARLKDKRMLLLLDNCEHVIDAAAALATTLIRGASGINILATSREPLAVAGEREFRLGPLASPVSADLISASEALAFPAVQLFVERATAVMEDFALSDVHAPLVIDICRKLDGLPLAIEFAAARVDVLGVHGLAGHLDDNLQSLRTRRRTAIPRHRTMRAAIDWSYGLLTEEERYFLRRLAIFAGIFTVEAAAAVAGQLPRSTIDLLADLAGKSLVTADISGGEAHFRLLATTRTYALGRLDESGDRQVAARAHAEYCCNLFERAGREWETRPMAEWRAAYGQQVDNLRTALDWAFSPVGDVSIGVALAAASVPIWFELSLLDECRRWMERALGVPKPGDPRPCQEMVLQCGFGYAMMFAQGMNDRARIALTKAKDLAERLADPDYQLRALAGLASICHRLQDFRGAVAFGRSAQDLVRDLSDPVAISIADWILGASLQLLGQYADAMTYAQRTYVRTAVPAVRRAHIARLGRDGFISAGSTIALIRWVRGLPDQSAQTARTVLADAEAGDHPLSRCLALTWCGCMIPLRTGDLMTAEHSIARLKDEALSHGLNAYYANGVAFEAQLLARQGDIVAAERLRRAGLKGLQQTQSDTLYTSFLSGWAEILMTAEALDESLEAADEAVQRAEQTNAFWWMPEALRVKGEVLVCLERPTEAAEHFHRSLDLASRQGALSWELRAATSLVRLWRDQGRSADALAVLKPVYDRFTEGFETADLKTARALRTSIEHCA